MEKKNDFFVVVPARSGSKSVKNKNIKKILNHPLIGYAIGIGKKIKYVEKVIFSSDSRKYLSIAKKYGADILHLRSKKNSSDTATDYDFIKEIIFFLKNKKITIPQFFILIRPNTPTRHIKEINKAVLKFKKNYKKFSSLISVTPMSETSYKTFEIKNNKLCGIYTNSFELDKFHKPRQMYPVTYSANGLIDIIKTELILKSKKTHGNKVMPFISNEIYVDIDHLNDLKYAEYIMKIKKYFVPKKND